MSPRLRVGVLILLAVAVSGLAAVLSLRFDGVSKGSPAPPGSSGSAGPAAGSGSPEITIPPSPTPRPNEGGTELYGFLPYWHVSDTVASYLEDVPLTTLAMFSVSARRNGAIDTRDIGYKRITSALGRRIIADAQARGTRVELVFTSFGEDRNGRFFGRLPATTPTPAPAPGAATSPLPSALTSPGPGQSATPAVAPWHRTVSDLVSLAADLDVDGINVDVEQLDELDRSAYGEFLAALRSALQTFEPGSTLTVATEAGLRGTGNAMAAIDAGVDRVFLMGYDYHWSGSQPGASSPVDRSDGMYTLRWSIDRYVEAGVPRDRIVLGLPLYGMSWRTLGPDRTAPVLGKGATWIPNRHLDVLLDPAFHPGRDPLEVAEFFIRADGDAWRVTYYDSPATLRAKLAFARDQGLAGGGFWAIGYDRGLPGYLDLMREFRAGKVARDEAPAAP